MGNFPSLSFRSLVPQAGTAHSNCRHRRWPPDPERRHLLQPDGARRCSRRPGGYPHHQYADGERETPCPACRPLPLGMSYPPALTLHAACTGSLRYGRTTLHYPAPPRAPISGTLRSCRNTQRNSRPFRTVALGMVGSLLTIPLPGSRSIRAIEPAGGTRTNWAGRQCPHLRKAPDPRYGCAWATVSTSWTSRPRRAGRACAISRRALRWPCRATGCGCWWPRAARRSCRGCWTGWSGARSHSI